MHDADGPLAYQASADGAAADAGPCCALTALANLLRLPACGVGQLYLRFEPVRRLGSRKDPCGTRVGVWVQTQASAAQGFAAQLFVPLSLAAAHQLQRACTAHGLRYVNNVGPSTKLERPQRRMA